MWRDKAAQHAQKEEKNKQHIKQHAPEQSLPRPCATVAGGCSGEVLQAARAKCKLLKHLTHRKDPEDGFVQTTNASLKKWQASSHPGSTLGLESRDH